MQSGILLHRCIVRCYMYSTGGFVDSINLARNCRDRDRLRCKETRKMKRHACSFSNPRNNGREATRAQFPSTRGTMTRIQPLSITLLSPLLLAASSVLAFQPAISKVTSSSTLMLSNRRRGATNWRDVSLMLPSMTHRPMAMA